MRKLLVILYFWLLGTRLMAQSGRDSTKRTLAIQVGYHFIQEEVFSRQPLWSDENFTEGFQAFYGNRMTPSVGASTSSRHKIWTIPFRWEQTVGLHYANQDYTQYTYYNVEYTPTGGLANFDVHAFSNKVEKLFLHYRTGLKFSLNKHIFAGPVAQLETIVAHRVSPPFNATTLTNTFDPHTNKLTNHSPVNLKLGFQAGMAIGKHLQIGFCPLIGLNPSIYIPTRYNYYNTQVGFFLNLKLKELRRTSP